MCTFFLDCHDHSEHCFKVKYVRGICNIEEFKKSCPRSCGICTGNGKCDNYIDFSYRCKYVGESGMCSGTDYWSKFVRQRCAKTCCQRGELHQ